MTKKRTSILLLLYVVLSIVAFAVILIIPQTREVFKRLSTDYAYPMGFVKFALLATAGELLAARMANKAWVCPPYLIARFVIWGVIGMWITFMMNVYSNAITILLPNAPAFVRALCISTTMNTTFGPTFMAVHKCSDTYLALRAQKAPRALGDVIEAVDWKRFVSFTLLKTVPIFWIPAHTVTFLLPSEYRVIMAAALSVALGVLLQLKRPASHKNAKTEEN